MKTAKVQTVKTYKAVRGAHLSDEDAAKIGPALEELAQEDGTDVRHLTPAKIVEAARDPHSPLHDYFDWDSETAAYQYRLMQARYLARSIRIQIVETRRKERTTFLLPGVVSVKVAQASEPRVYVPMVVARERPELMAQIKAEAKARILYWRTQYAQYRRLESFSDLEPVFAAIDSLDAENPLAG